MSTVIVPAPEVRPCVDPDHHPPSHLYIPVGSAAVHTCPACGKVTVMQRLPVSM